MSTKLNDDGRIDSRIKALMGAMPAASQSDATSREQVVAEANSDVAVAAREHHAHRCHADPVPD